MFSLHTASVSFCLSQADIPPAVIYTQRPYHSVYPRQTSPQPPPTPSVSIILSIPGRHPPSRHLHPASESFYLSQADIPPAVIYTQRPYHSVYPRQTSTQPSSTPSVSIILSIPGRHPSSRHLHPASVSFCLSQADIPPAVIYTQRQYHSVYPRQTSLQPPPTPSVRIILSIPGRHPSSRHLHPASVSFCLSQADIPPAATYTQRQYHSVYPRQTSLQPPPTPSVSIILSIPGRHPSSRHLHPASESFYLSQAYIPPAATYTQRQNHSIYPRQTSLQPPPTPSVQNHSIYPRQTSLQPPPTPSVSIILSIPGRHPSSRHLHPASVSFCLSQADIPPAATYTQREYHSVYPRQTSLQPPPTPSVSIILSIPGKHPSSRHLHPASVSFCLSQAGIPTAATYTQRPYHSVFPRQTSPSRHLHPASVSFCLSQADIPPAATYTQRQYHSVYPRQTSPQPPPTPSVSIILSIPADTQPYQYHSVYPRQTSAPPSRHLHPAFYLSQAIPPAATYTQRQSIPGRHPSSRHPISFTQTSSFCLYQTSQRYFCLSQADIPPAVT